jgi:hypothetical protein
VSQPHNEINQQDYLLCISLICAFRMFSSRSEARKNAECTYQ